MDKQQITRIPLKYGPILQTLGNESVGKIFKNILLGNEILNETEKIYFDLIMVDIGNIDKKAGDGNKGGRPRKKPKVIENEKPMDIENTKPSIDKNRIYKINKDKISIENNNLKEIDTIVSIEQSSFGNSEINNLIELVKNELIKVGFLYKKGMYERQRATNILTGKEFGDYANKVGQTPTEFAINIVKASFILDFRRGKIYNCETIYKHYAQIYNDTISKKAKENQKVTKEF